MCKTVGGNLDMIVRVTLIGLGVTVIEIEHRSKLITSIFSDPELYDDMPTRSHTLTTIKVMIRFY